MKKMYGFLAGICAAVFAFGGCGAGNGDGSSDSSSGVAGKVSLIPIAPADISPALGYDYYLAAEPLASLKVKMTASSQMPLHVVADLQKLYGGENGYPQAVLVAKNSFIAENGVWVRDFMEDMVDAAAWLTAETTEISTVVQSVAANLTEGLNPSLSTANLTKSVIENCGVRFVIYHRLARQRNLNCYRNRHKRRWHFMRPFI